MELPDWVRVVDDGGNKMLIAEPTAFIVVEPDVLMSGDADVIERLLVCGVLRVMGWVDREYEALVTQVKGVTGGEGCEV